jgi:hypothetical protein
MVLYTKAEKIYKALMCTIAATQRVSPQVFISPLLTDFTSLLNAMDQLPLVLASYLKAVAFLQRFAASH